MNIFFIWDASKIFSYTGGVKKCINILRDIVYENVYTFLAPSVDICLHNVQINAPLKFL